MSDQDPKQTPTGNAEKDPSDWVTGEEPMTGAQASYLQTLSQEAGVEFDESPHQGGGLRAHRRAAGQDGARGT